MSIRVKVEGVGYVSFPDGTTADEMSEALNKSFPAPAKPVSTIAPVAVAPPPVAKPKATPKSGFYPVMAPTWLPTVSGESAFEGPEIFSPQSLTMPRGPVNIPFQAPGMNFFRKALGGEPTEEQRIAYAKRKEIENQARAAANSLLSPGGVVIGGLTALAPEIVGPAAGLYFGAETLGATEGELPPGGDATPEEIGAYRGRKLFGRVAGPLMAITGGAKLGLKARNVAARKLMNRPGVTGAAPPGPSAPPTGAAPSMTPEQIQAAIDAANAQLQKTPEGLSVEPSKTPPPAPPTPTPAVPPPAPPAVPTTTTREPKGEPNALPVRSPEALPIRQTPGDSAKMVEGVPPPEEAAVPKEAPPLPPPGPQDAGVRDVAPIPRRPAVPKKVRLFTSEGLSPSDAEALLAGAITPEQLVEQGRGPSNMTKAAAIERLKVLKAQADRLPEPQENAAQARRRQAQERPFDIIDHTIGAYGKIRPKAKMKPGEEGYYTDAYDQLVKTSAGRKLFDPNATQGFDEAIDNLRRDGTLGPDASVDDLIDSYNKAAGYRSRYFKGETPEQQRGAFWDAQKKLATRGPSQKITVGELNIGDRFTINGKEFEVVDVSPEGEVKVKDGTKFGSQIVPDESELVIDRDSIETGPKTSEDWPQPEPASPEKPDFALAPIESDAEKIAREAKEAETARVAEAKKKMLEQAAAPLTGKPVDTTGDMFDHRESENALFINKTPPKPGLVSGTPAEASAKARMAERIAKSKKMGIQPGENPFNDPKVLSDLVIIGVGALERGARDFAAWSKEMLAHDPNLAPHLPNLFAVTQGFYKQHVQQGLPVAGTAPTPSPAAPTGPPPAGTPPQTFQAPPGPGTPTPPPGVPPGNVPAAGFPAPGGAIPPATAIGVVPNSTWYRSNWFKADRWLDELGKYYKRRFDHAWKDIPQMLDAGDNIAHNEGRQARIMMELRYQPHELDAMTFAAQSFEQGAPQLALLDRFEQDIANAPQGYPPDLIERALKAVRYAKQHITDKNFMDGVQMLRDRYDSQWSYEKRNGINTDYRDNYINQMWDFDIMIDPRQSVVFGRGKHYGPSSSFRKDRTFNDYAEGIRAGYAYKTLNAAELLENRVRQGSIIVGNRQWFNMWKNVTDPVTKTPIVRNMIPEIDPATGKLTGWKLPDHGMYKLFTPHGNKVGFGVHEGWDSMFHRLLDPSRADESAWRSEALRLAAGLKHKLLLLDTYHGFRILYSTVAAAPKAQLEGLRRYGESSAKSFYFRGLSALEYRDADLALAQTKGLLTPEEVTWIRQVRPDVDMLMKNGLNAARFSAAMYDRLNPTGIFRATNRYIFEKFSRGAMVQTALSEFQRLKEANPTVAHSIIAKQVARDVNVLFGNIQRQGIFQSAGARDLLHAVFLAPQWNEALIRRDIMGTAQLAGFGPKELQRGGIAQGGTLGKTLATGLLAHIFLNQILNYVTRGHSTFENTEPGQKLSAWIPDVMGGSPGYFFSPTAVFGEATGELNDLVRRKGTIPEAVSQYLENKFGPGGKFLHVLATGQDYDGLARNFGHRIGKAANALIPMPIPLSGVLSERPGSMQKQAMSAAGLRTSFAPTAAQEIQELVKEWKRTTKDDSRGLWQPFDDDPYKQMHDALRNNNKADFAKAYGVALDRYPKQQVNESMRRWSVAPFAGTQQKENAFKKTLTPDQLQRYDQAKEEKRSAFRRFQEFRDLVR